MSMHIAYAQSVSKTLPDLFERRFSSNVINNIGKFGIVYTSIAIYIIRCIYIFLFKSLFFKQQGVKILRTKIRGRSKSFVS